MVAESRLADLNNKMNDRAEPLGTTDPVDDVSALRRLRDWRGLSQISEALKRLRGQPNFFATVPRPLRAEGVHSDMLAWLLTPGEWHGLGERVAAALVRDVFAGCRISCAQPVRIGRVYREFSTGNGPIDLLLQGTHGHEQFTIGIENKIDSPESEEQLFKYGEGLQSPGRRPDGKLMLVLLAPDKRQVHRKPTCDFTTLTYRSVAEILDRALERDGSEPADHLSIAGRTLASHYAAALRNHIMPDSNPEIDALCRELYAEHERAWRAIRRRLPSERDEHHERIGLAVCKRLSDTPGGRWIHVVRRDAYVRVFREEWLQLGSKTSQTPVGLSSSGRDESTYAALHFRIVAEPAETDADTRFRYVLRLKGPAPLSPASKAVADAIRGLKDKVPDDREYTIVLRSKATLPPIQEDGEVPDDVLAWYLRRMAPYIQAIDQVITPNVASS